VEDIQAAHEGLSPVVAERGKEGTRDKPKVYLFLVSVSTIRGEER
jgi:hypothetical protein